MTTLDPRLYHDPTAINQMLPAQQIFHKATQTKTEKPSEILVTAGFSQTRHMGWDRVGFPDQSQSYKIRIIILVSLHNHNQNDASFTILHSCMRQNSGIT